MLGFSLIHYKSTNTLFYFPQDEFLPCNRYAFLAFFKSIAGNFVYK